ncbi:hypothetical protein [Streptomyces sp. NPDC060022]|uniref:hypothetical protein n=1 Tax=Streptomyces sp. NPDC060022 TaxID=3347039 RepID=UPI0036C4FF2A
MSPRSSSAGFVMDGGDLIEHVVGWGAGHAQMVDEGGVGREAWACRECVPVPAGSFHDSVGEAAVPKV